MTEFHVVVLGTGAAGLTAALAAHEAGASVGLYDRADRVGGTTAWSGGMVWIPNNHHMADVGVTDSREDALRYLRAISLGTAEEALIESFVDQGPRVIRWLEDTTPVEFYTVERFPDYHPEVPGGKPQGGRSLECPPYEFAQLGAWADRVTVGYQMDFRSTMNETPLGTWPTITPEEYARRVKEDLRAMGESLAGRLLKGCLDRGIEPVTGARARQLVCEDGRVTGVRLEAAGGAVSEVHARRGVVLACGGFEWDSELRRSFLRGPVDRPVSVPTNTGDGLRMAMQAGAALANMREAWWYPTVDLPVQGELRPFQIMTHAGWPRCIVVNRAGRRFYNEATNYNASGAAFHFLDPTSYEYTNLPCWAVFDHEHLTRYGFSAVPGAMPTTDAADSPDWLVSAPTVGELADRLGIDRQGLESTIERWNRHCAKGADPDFHRGVSAHDRWWGDPSFDRDTTTCTLGPLDTPPFHAAQVRPGILGTKGGPKTDPSGHVLDLDGNQIPGLFAAGNVMASCTGSGYGGAGGTLGPAIVFGALAGAAAAKQQPANLLRLAATGDS